ncbi:hypothetical protein INT43_007240 [Umbelopsis isabellina]|uniref:Uncharacterized protein n=1 Tax=Mortierella isabellina TaxID=91625 RepID=A0A8H7PXZ1_MORIS|nr:hypothetical protein INT43_007240 [Umbelopsis isabellina]
MCAGDFTRPCTSESEKETYQQVALAGNNGIIYILENYKVTSFVHVDYSITRVLRYRPKSLPESSPDILICAGHCNEIRAYYYGELITTYGTQDWVHDMILGDIDGDGKDELVMGLLNQTIAVLKCSIEME